MTLYLHYRCGKLSKWRRVPIPFRNHEEAEAYYKRYLEKTDCKKKILFAEEEQMAASKKYQRKRALKKAGKYTLKGLAITGREALKGAKKVHKRLLVAGPRDMDRMRSELGEPRQKTITAYDRTLKEIKREKRKKERRLTDEDLRKLARKRSAEKSRSRQRTTQTKKKAWKPPPTPFGEFKLNLDQTGFVDQRQQAKKYETGGPGFKTPFDVGEFNPNPDVWGFNKDKKKKNKRR